MKLIFENWRVFLKEATLPRGEQGVENHPDWLDIKKQAEKAEEWNEPAEGKSLSLREATRLVESYLESAPNSAHIINWFRDGFPTPVKYLSTTKLVQRRGGQQKRFTKEGGEYWRKLKESDASRKKPSSNAIKTRLSLILTDVMSIPNVSPDTDFVNPLAKKIARRLEEEFEEYDKMFLEGESRSFAPLDTHPDFVKFQGAAGVVSKERGRNWGQRRTIEFVNSLSDLATKTGRTWYIEDIALPGGGEIDEHGSHAIGLMVDIALPVLKGYKPSRRDRDPVTKQPMQSYKKDLGIAISSGKVMRPREILAIRRRWYTKGMEEFKEQVELWKQIGRGSNKVSVRTGTKKNEEFKKELEHWKRTGLGDKPSKLKKIYTTYVIAGKQGLNRTHVAKAEKAIQRLIDKNEYKIKKQIEARCIKRNDVTKECEDYDWQFADVEPGQLDADAALEFLFHALRFRDSEGKKVAKVLLDKKLIKKIKEAGAEGINSGKYKDQSLLRKVYSLLRHEDNHENHFHVVMEDGWASGPRRRFTVRHRARLAGTP